MATLGHRLFISAFMLSSKIICDDTYSNKSWPSMFTLREIKQMERAMCSYVEWQLNVDPSMLRDFQHRVQQDFTVSKSPRAIQDHGTPAAQAPSPPSFPLPARSVSKKCGTPVSPYLPHAHASAAHTQHDAQVVFFFPEFVYSAPRPRQPARPPLHPEVEASAPLQGINAHPLDATIPNASLACPHRSHAHT